jgi:hypothetical protein
MGPEDYRQFLTELSTEDLVRRLERATRKHEEYRNQGDRASWVRNKSWEARQITDELARRQGVLDGF